MKYFAMIDGERRGPLELRELVEAGVRPDTYVWCKGMSDWVQAREVADICRHLRNRLHDRMHPVVEEAEVLPAAFGEQMPVESGNYRQLRAQINSLPENEDVSQPPLFCPRWLMLLAFIGFFPLAIAALMSDRSARAAWERHENQAAHDDTRKAKMMAGVAVCLGVMIVATIIRLL